MTAWSGSPFPPKFVAFHDYQIDAANKAIEAFARGVDVVVLNAPTGSGKTVLAEMIRRGLATPEPKSTFICHSLTLQDQFLADFEYSRAIKGRANYPTANVPMSMATCADCTGETCHWCPTKSQCAYLVAARQSVVAPVAVLNTAYMLTRRPTIDPRGKVVDPYLRDFMVIDEADTLEGELMRHLEFRVGAKMLGDLGVRPPVKAARKTTLAAWLVDDFGPACREAAEKLSAQGVLTLGGVPGEREIKDARRAKRLIALGEQAETVAGQLADGQWVRDYDRNEQDVILKPVTVHEQAPAALWDRGKARGAKWLCMSGTIISPDEWAKSTGVDEAGLSWELVDVPMMFDVENRPVVVKAVADMSRGGGPNEFDRLIKAIEEILDRYPQTNTLIHTVSYALMRDIVARLRLNGRQGVMSYETAGDRDLALRRFVDGGGVIVAPSLDRGVDLPGDLCRVQIVTKVPFPYLGDRQVSERMHMPDGNLWYAVQTARSLVQMTGRAVRSQNDWADTYVLDKQFGKWYSRWGRRLLPKWWRDAIVSQGEVKVR